LLPVRFDAELGFCASGLPGFLPFSSGFFLPVKQTWPKAAQALAAGATLADAAKAAEVTQRTVRNWRNDEPRFADAVDDARSLMLAETAGLLAATTTTAARRLEEIIETGEERHQLAAARVVLDMAARYRSDRALEDRISALEMAVGVRSSW